MRALRVAVLGTVMGAGIAVGAIPAGAVSYSAGEDCPLSLHGQTTADDSGHPLTCEDQGGTWKWVATSSSPSTTAPTDTTTVPVTTTAPSTTTTTTASPTTTLPSVTTTAAPATSPGGALPTTGPGPAVTLLATLGTALVLVALTMLACVFLRRPRTHSRP